MVVEAGSIRVRRENLGMSQLSLVLEAALDPWDLPALQEKEELVETKEGLDCGALQVMMESLVYQVSPVSQDLQDIHRTQEVWEPRWLERWMENKDLKPCYLAQGERLEQEDLLGQVAHLAKLDPKDLLEMLAIQGIWVHLGKGDLRALQGNRVKMENQANQEILEKLDSLDQREPEDFQVHLGHLD